MNRLRHYRLSRDLTQAKLAGKVHVSETHIKALEHEWNKPSPGLAQILAGYFGVKVEAIFPDGVAEKVFRSKFQETQVPMSPPPAAPVPDYPREFRVVCPKCGISLCHTTERSRNLMGDDLTCYACGQGYGVSHA